MLNHVGDELGGVLGETTKTNALRSQERETSHLHQNFKVLGI
jgi:hypothetical protein